MADKAFSADLRLRESHENLRSPFRQCGSGQLRHPVSLAEVRQSKMCHRFQPDDRRRCAQVDKYLMLQMNIS
jgi:hypothetical protein